MKKITLKPTKEKELHKRSAFDGEREQAGIEFDGFVELLSGLRWNLKGIIWEKVQV